VTKNVRSLPSTSAVTFFEVVHLAESVATEFPKVDPLPIFVRSAVPLDADAIARIFLESAEYHARLDPERYSPPTLDKVSARYREGRQHPAQPDVECITLVAEQSGEIVGFLDARLERSPDPMHRELIYCNIVEIAVSSRSQRRGIGGQLLRAAEEWGRGQGAEFALLEYHAANSHAREFYQRHMGYGVASVTAIKHL
jgi:ribosomal protein S18 acetylase RimI-like enzyme